MLFLCVFLHLFEIYIDFSAEYITLYLCIYKFITLYSLQWFWEFGIKYEYPSETIL